jgi:hypothetical protein
VQKILFISAVFVGLTIAWVDSQPTWDDTGITVFSILFASASLGALSPLRPWLWALAVGIWIPLSGVIFTHNYGGILALGFAFIGAYAGMLVRRLVSPDPGKTIS